MPITPWDLHRPWFNIMEMPNTLREMCCFPDNYCCGSNLYACMDFATSGEQHNWNLTLTSAVFICPRTAQVRHDCHWALSLIHFPKSPCRKMPSHPAVILHEWGKWQRVNLITQWILSLFQEGVIYKELTGASTCAVIAEAEGCCAWKLG